MNRNLGLRVSLMLRLQHTSRWFYGASLMLSLLAISHCANGGALWWSGLVLIGAVVFTGGVGLLLDRLGSLVFPRAARVPVVGVEV